MGNGHLGLVLFLLALPKTLKRVRLDVMPQALPNGFTDVDWDSELFLFVTVYLIGESDLS